MSPDDEGCQDEGGNSDMGGRLNGSTSLSLAVSRWETVFGFPLTTCGNDRLVFVVSLSLHAGIIGQYSLVLIAVD